MLESKNKKIDGDYSLGNNVYSLRQKNMLEHIKKLFVLYSLGRVFTVLQSDCFRTILPSRLYA